MNGQVLPKLPTLSPEKYRWEKSKTDARIRQRRGNGAEAIVGMKDSNLKGQYDIYLLTTLCTYDVSTTMALSLSILKEKLQAALLDVRFQHPDIACTAVWDDQVAPLIQYTPPENNEDALTWAQDTIQIHAGPQTGLDVRIEIEKRRRFSGCKPTKSVSIYIIADVVNEKTALAPGTVVDVLIHMNHLYWDGISAWMFAGDLLRTLNQNFGVEQKVSQYNWGEEIAHLGVPALDALNIDIGSLDDDFDAARDKYIRGLLSSHVSRFFCHALPSNIATV